MIVDTICEVVDANWPALAPPGFDYQLDIDPVPAAQGLNLIARFVFKCDAPTIGETLWHVMVMPVEHADKPEPVKRMLFEASNIMHDIRSKAMAIPASGLVLP